MDQFPENERVKASSAAEEAPTSSWLHRDNDESKEEPEEQTVWLRLDENWDEAAEDFLDESNHSIPAVASLPPQLHPAVSMGMKRVSSCYFSIQSSQASHTDLLSLWEEEEEKVVSTDGVAWNASVVLYHDICMHIFTFLDGPSLAAFSETARRPNFECFYFLQLQLQRAMLVEPNSRRCDSLDAIAGVGSISRLAVMDKTAAHDILQDYQDSNSTLRTMPLSHSLAYIRQVLSRNEHDGPPHALASAAVVITILGAASYTMDVHDLPNTLFKVGLAGSLMRAGVTARDAARKLSDADNHNNETTTTTTTTATTTAEQMARRMQQFPSHVLQQLHSMQSRETNESSTTNFPSSIAARMYAAFTSAYGHPDDSTRSNGTETRARPRRSKRSHKGDVVVRQDQPSIARIDEEHHHVNEEVMLHPMTPNPYEHLPAPSEEEEENHQSTQEESTDHESATDCHTMPSGCVGAYSRAVHQATSRVTQLLKEQRKSNYDALSMGEQLQVSTTFIEACTSDDSLSTVKDMIQTRNIIEVDRFYVGSDGTETCALHTAAFHGACRVLEFLCGGIDETCADKDGGLCDVNLKDANGWTAMHYAGGANCVEAVQILSRHGAQLAVEAANGYTPYHWAQRLSNHDVAEELERLGADQRFLEIGWIRSQPLSMIASRFFSLIPTH